MHVLAPRDCKITVRLVLGDVALCCVRRKGGAVVAELNKKRGQLLERKNQF